MLIKQQTTDRQWKVNLIFQKILLKNFSVYRIIKSSPSETIRN